MQSIRSLLVALVALIFVLVLMPAGQALALELQLGASGVAIAGADEHDDANTVMPFVAIGGDVGDELFVFLEAGTLDYSVDKSGDRSDLELSEGEIDISAASYAVVLQPRFENIDLRAGYGIVNYSYENKLSDDVIAAFEAAGATSVEVELDDAQGTQWLVGADWLLGEMFSVGVEYREIDVETEGTGTLVSASGTTTNTGDVDLSHNWTAVRALVRF